MSIWIIVSLSIAVVLVCILVFRLHAFLTLLAAGLLVAVLSAGAPLAQYAEYQVDTEKMTTKEADQLLALAPSTRLVQAFGSTSSSQL